MSEVRVGVYPGTFDPTTLGHVDIVKRALRVVDRLIVGVAVNAGKGPLFDGDERVAHVEQEIADLVRYLCSHQGRHISGQAINIDANLETYAGMDKLD